jgi:hypothetical protein
MPTKYRTLMENYERWVKDQDSKYKDSEPIPAEVCVCPPREGSE